ncbi:MAG: 3-dehydroquinate synthase [Thermoplasmataceae archaeon]|jgi:3-dehydroquinate synthase
MESDSFSLNEFGIGSTVTIGNDVTREFIDSKFKSYGYYIVSKRISTLYPDLVAHIRDDNTGYVESIPDGEEAKSLESYSMVIQHMIERNVDRDSFVSYIGGGTIGDMAGFVASTYKRGITLEAFPTTLLAMVDSAIGGKNALNHGLVKNVIGTFYDPANIVCDISFLNTLNRREFLEGVPEIIKYGLISDPGILPLLSSPEFTVTRDPEVLKKIIKRSIMIKSSFVSGDVHDTKGKRTVLNLGHTLAHALESASHNKLSHGISVAEGIVFEAFVSLRKGVCTRDTFQYVLDIVKSAGIDLPDTAGFDPHELIRFIENDKKSVSGSVNMPLIRIPGQIITLRIPVAEIESMLVQFNGIDLNGI